MAEKHGLKNLFDEGSEEKRFPRRPNPFTPPEEERVNTPLAAALQKAMEDAEETLPQPSLAEKSLTPTPPPFVALEKKISAPPAQERPETPTLSVVVPLTDEPSEMRRPLQALAEQTKAEWIEVIGVGPSRQSAITAFTPLGRCHSVQFIEDDGSQTEGHVMAQAMLAANAPYVALLDPHGTPARDFAEQVMRVITQKDDWAVLGTHLINGNPHAGTSWAVMLPENLAQQFEPEGTVKTLPTRNSIYRKDTLSAVGDDLPRLINRNELPATLYDLGEGKLRRDRETLVSVISPSRYSTMLAMRFLSGRLAAAQEVKTKKLGALRRLFRSLNAAVWPQGRYNKIKPALYNGQGMAATPQLHGRAIFLGYISESFGRAKGYLFGPGQSARKLALLKRGRHQSLSESDKRRFFAEQNSPRRRVR